MKATCSSFGASAGGHLSASIGIALAAGPATALDASVVWFPPVDFPTMDSDIETLGTPRATGRNGGPKSPESRLIGACVADNPDLAREAGPIARLGDLPPEARLPDMLIMHGAKDPYIAATQLRRLHAAVASHQTASRLDLDILPEGTHGGGEFEDPQTMAKVSVGVVGGMRARRGLSGLSGWMTWPSVPKMRLVPPGCARTQAE